jgi:hypothetical protein
MTRRARLLLPALALAALVVAACSEDMAMAQSFIRQWASDHAVEIGAAALGAPSGDAYVDAAVQGGMVVKEIAETDALVEEGWKKGDTSKADDALKKRPNDWSVALSRANMALRDGDMATYEALAPQSLRKAQSGKDSTAATYAWDRQDYAEMLRVHDGIMGGPRTGFDAFRSYAQCAALYDRLKSAANEPQFPERGKDWDRWDTLRDACDAIPH